MNLNIQCYLSHLQGYEPHIPLNPEILKQRQAELQLENEVLTKTVQMVFRDINEEAALLDQLSTHCKRYKERMKELEEWLDATPNVDELQTLQKKIKVARSKLRHLLVDLRDGEEVSNIITILFTSVQHLVLNVVLTADRFLTSVLNQREIKLLCVPKS